MKLGELEFHIVSDGPVFLDGGAMFGVIPKPMWEKKCPADAPQPHRTGDELPSDPRRRQAHSGRNRRGRQDEPEVARHLRSRRPALAHRGLRDYGLAPEDIDIVIDTHLHFDHCGGNTRMEKDKVVATFPKRAIHRAKGRIRACDESRPSATARAYFESNYVPLGRGGTIAARSRETAEIVPGVEVVRVPGHTANMQCVKLTGGGKTAFFLADLVPMTAHLPLPWIMGYDLYPMTTLENKKKWIPRIVREGWLALFGARCRECPRPTCASATASGKPNR